MLVDASNTLSKMTVKVRYLTFSSCKFSLKHLDSYSWEWALSKIGVLLYDGCYASSLTGVIDAFQIANAHIANLSPAASLFSWVMVSIDGKPVKSHGGLVLQPDMAMNDMPEVDVIYIPACFYSGAKKLDQWLSGQKPMREWLIKQWNNGVILATSCTGTFVLADTGLLDGKKATTTWWLEPQFKRRYPWVNLQVKELITEDQRLICAGAMTSNLYLAIHLIERYVSAEIASVCAKVMLIDMGHTAQSPYQSLFSLPDISDPLIDKVVYRLQTHYKNSIDLLALAEEFAVSQRTLIRRFKAEMDMTPLVYLQNIRLESAKNLLENSHLSLLEVTESVGYSDISSFSRLFKERLGLTPLMYRKRFQVNVAS